MVIARGQQNMFETLEPRRMFAVSVVMNKTVLAIAGTDNADTIFVTQNGSNFDIVQQIAGVGYPLASIPVSMVTRISMDGKKGDDFLTVQTTGSIGADIYGSDGNDEIHLEDDGTAISIGHGGNGNDLMAIYHGKGTKAYGDANDDTLISYERTYRTYLYGGDGNDKLTGTALTTIDGGKGTNTITIN
jgi:hypothetical protein